MLNWQQSRSNDVSVDKKLIDDYQVTELHDHDEEFTATTSAGFTTWIKVEDFYSDVDEYFAELMTMKNKTWVTQMKYRDMFYDYVQ